MGRKPVSTSYLLTRLGSMSLFWRLRHKLQLINFKRLRMGFVARVKINNIATEASVLGALSRGTVIPIALSLLVGIGIYAFEENMHILLNYSWLNSSFIGDYLRHSLNEENYVQMLTAIAGVSGVLLGLYFTAISTLANAYSSVSSDIRELILNDKINDRYVRVIAFITAQSVVLLALTVYNPLPLHLAFPLLTILSSVAVFAFVNLSTRTFRMSDPTIFFRALSTELLNWVEKATYSGWQWQNPNFQTHYRKRAYRTATTLATLTRVSREKNELRGESYSQLLRNLLALVNYYAQKKRFIPINSAWYHKKYLHKQWYLTETTELETATQTNTTLSPKEIPHPTWLEDIILDEVFDGLSQAINKGEIQSLYAEAMVLPDFFREMAENWRATESEKWFTKFADNAVSDICTQEITDEQMPYSIGLVDILASLPMALELGLIDAINKLDIDKLREQLQKTKWSENNSPYRINLPSSVIKALEEVHEGVVFEIQARSKHKTQNWYITELAFNSIDMDIYKQWQSTIKLLDEWYFETGKRLKKAKKYKHSATVYSRAIELAWKMDSHIENIKQQVELMRRDSKIDFTHRPDWKWDDEHDRVKKFREKAIQGQADLIPHLWNTEKPDPELPDFFGGVVHRTGEACYEALADGDSEGFKKLFRTYFFGILGIFESIRSNKEVQGWEQSSAIAWMSEPIIDLFDISGYAYIYSELYDKPEIWVDCKNVWDAYISELPQQLDSFAVISKYHQTPRMMITPRATLRSKWEILLAQKLIDLPRQETADVFSRGSADHQSQLIRNIAPSSDLPSMYCDAIDVFTVKYFLERDGDNSDLDYGIDNSKVSHVNDVDGDSDV